MVGVYSRSYGDEWISEHGMEYHELFESFYPWLMIKRQLDGFWDFPQI